MTSVSSTLGVLFRELVDGRSSTEAYVLNEGDIGLLRSLDRLSAAEASRRPPGRASVAAHIDHMRYSLHRLNGWASKTALEPPDWRASWRRSEVAGAEWEELRAELAHEVSASNEALARERAVDDETH